MPTKVAITDPDGGIPPEAIRRVLKRVDAENGWVSARKPAKEFAKANSRTYWDNLSPEQRSAEMRFEHRQRPAPFLLRLRIDGVRRAAANNVTLLFGARLEETEASENSALFEIFLPAILMTQSVGSL